jgi:hypothetical protein
MKTKLLITLAALIAVISNARANGINDYSIYRKAVNETSQMSRDASSRAAAKSVGLDVMNVTWEDTGRSKGSSMGPNISDMTIQVHTVNDKGDIAPVAMPIVRYPNFADKTADISPNKFMLLVGNQENETLRKISLTEYLDNFRSYLSNESSWKGSEESLLAPRDTHVLVSAQAAFLPIPQGQKAHFNPVLFNYQSSKENPAVLTILVTREGTSATIIDNTRDAFKSGWGQRLFFNQNGEKASLTGERQSDFSARIPTIRPSVINPNMPRPLSPPTALNSANGQGGMNMVMLIQVPLVHKQNNRMFPMNSMNMAESVKRSMTSAPVENAVIGHGPVEGKYTEIDDLEIKRDARFPIRVTVQFYKATDSKTLTPAIAQELRAQIDRVYKNADYVGSLVTEGKTSRPTEHNVKYCSPRWWNPIWPLHLASTDTKINEEEAVNSLRRHYGPYWVRYCRTPELFTSALEFVNKK